MGNVSGYIAILLSHTHLRDAISSALLGFISEIFLTHSHADIPQWGRDWDLFLPTHYPDTPVQPERHFLAQDDDSHWYLVPVSKRAEWDAWRNIPSDNPESWNVPDFAQAVDGPHTVEFYLAPVDTNRILTGATPAPSKVEHVWLIETPGTHARYVGVECGRLCWVYTAEFAIRFSRKQDAENMMGVLDLAFIGPNATVTEHAWVDGPTAPPTGAVRPNVGSNVPADQLRRNPEAVHD